MAAYIYIYIYIYTYVYMCIDMLVIVRGPLHSSLTVHGAW